MSAAVLHALRGLTLAVGAIVAVVVAVGFGFTLAQNYDARHAQARPAATPETCWHPTDPDVIYCGRADGSTWVWAPWAPTWQRFEN
jgi:hypothetical protein